MQVAPTNLLQIFLPHIASPRLSFYVCRLFGQHRSSTSSHEEGCRMTKLHICSRSCETQETPSNAFRSLQGWYVAAGQSLSLKRWDCGSFSVCYQIWRQAVGQQNSNYLGANLSVISALLLLRVVAPACVGDIALSVTKILETWLCTVMQVRWITKRAGHNDCCNHVCARGTCLVVKKRCADCSHLAIHWRKATFSGWCCFALSLYLFACSRDEQ